MSMSNSFFRFKQFTVYQDLCALKVGTDGVLLGAWTKIQSADKRILDIGSGTGLISLMMAQRSEAFIDAIDIDEGAFRQTAINFEQSPFSARLHAYHTSLQDYFPAQKYDLIVSNPPYFSDSLKSPSQQKNQARHNDSLKFEDLIAKSADILNPNGKITLILPYDAYAEINNIATAHHFYLNELTKVYPTRNSLHPKRVLLSYSYIKMDITKNVLYIEKQRHTYTPEFRELVRNYYLMES
jgi:Predicted O-methyltransferase